MGVTRSENLHACSGAEDGQCGPYPACGIYGLVPNVPGALMMQFSRFRVSGFGFRVSGFGSRVSGLGSRVSGFGFGCTPEETSQ